MQPWVFRYVSNSHLSPEDGTITQGEEADAMQRQQQTRMHITTYNITFFIIIIIIITIRAARA
jgi:cytochrome oxidase assembly protein ShyY1